MPAVWGGRSCAAPGCVMWRVFCIAVTDSLFRLRDKTALYSELLEHKSLKTTKIYTYMSNKDIEGIKSPLDSMAKDSYLEDGVERHED